MRATGFDWCGLFAIKNAFPSSDSLLSNSNPEGMVSYVLFLSKKPPASRILE